MYVGGGSKSQTAVFYVPSRSLRTRQGLFRLEHTRFSVWGRSLKGSNRGLLRTIASFLGASRSISAETYQAQCMGAVSQGVKPRSPTYHPTYHRDIFGRIKASIGPNIAHLAYGGDQSSGHTAVSYHPVILDASRPLFA